MGWTEKLLELDSFGYDCGRQNSCLRHDDDRHFKVQKGRRFSTIYFFLLFLTHFSLLLCMGELNYHSLDRKAHASLNDHHFSKKYLINKETINIESKELQNFERNIMFSTSLPTIIQNLFS